jgi:ATP/maltotriose-dependent transcriptional regulator MalT
VRDDPAFRALVREMAATWIASAERKPEPTQAELQSLARAYIARGELEQALEALERGVALGGPRTAQLAAEARAVRAGIESGNRERVRIGVGSQR